MVPPNATALERAIERATEAALALPVAISTLWDAESCPSAFLPWLAWALSIDYPWALAESDDARRAVIKSSFDLHRRKGTPWAIREVIRALGFGEVNIIEGLGGIAYDGQWLHNGLKSYGGAPNDWAVYRVVLEQAITNDQAARLREALTEIAPARCHLDALIYDAVPIRYNSEAVYDGQYNHGSA